MENAPITLHEQLVPVVEQVAKDRVMHPHQLVDGFVYQSAGLALSQVYYRAIACDETQKELGASLGSSMESYFGW